MQAVRVFLAAVAVSVLLMIGYVDLVSGSSKSSSSQPPLEVRDDDVLEQRIAALEAKLERSMKELASQAPRGEQRSEATLGRDEVIAIVEEYLASRDKAASNAAAKPTAASLLSELGKVKDDASKAIDVWARAAKLGLTDQMLASLRDRAKNLPQDAEAQFALGGALLQALNAETNDMKKGVMAAEADKAFDAALAIDEGHWDARFVKAMSLSFWPAFLGKRDEAIRNFEILVDRQELGRREAKQAQSYLLLGNLYQQSGKLEEARKMWERGLARFPGDASLTQRLAETRK